MEQVNNPKVSVLMPIYKTDEKYLRQAIESILSQTFGDFEFLILDDCPDDAREDIVKSYKDIRIKYIKNEINLGITPTRNKLIEFSKGEYLAIMDHDDVSRPNRFAKQVEYLDSNPEVGVVGSNVHMICSNRDIVYPSKDQDIKTTLMMKCAIVHPSSMVRKSVLTDNNIRYNEHYSPSEDYKLWCDLIDVTNFYNIPEVLFNYRDHKANTSNKQNSKMEEASFNIRAENEFKYPVLWKKYVLTKARFVKLIRLFSFIPFLKIEQKGRRSKYFLFDLIPLFSIKNSVKF